MLLGGCGAGQSARALPPLRSLTAPASLSCPQAVLDEGFEYVTPTGVVQTRADLLAWLADAGYGSKATAGAPAAPSAAGGGGGGAAASRTRMWVDRWSERQLAPGVWLARYMELHQPFAGAWVRGLRRRNRSLGR